MVESIIELDGNNLSIEDVLAVTRNFNAVKLSEKAITRIKRSAAIVQEIIDHKRQVYGVTTGFGFLQNIVISPNDVKKLQYNLIRSHAAGVGPEFPQDVVRGMMLLQLNKFARGHSGIRLEVVLLLLEILNKGITPIVPSQGSLGASGDLAPLAHLSLVLIGEGFAEINGKRVTGKEALKKAELTPIELIAKEGLALLNGTQAMTSLAALVCSDAEYLITIANLAASMSMEVHRANVDALHPLIHQARPHNGQITVAKCINEYLKGSKRVRSQIGYQDCYSLRCVPAVHGATLDTIDYAKNVLKIEMNSSTDNPLIFNSNQILSGCNFHGEPIAFVMDFLSIALVEIGNISERRIERLLNPNLSGLPAFLTSKGGINSGLMIAQYTAASLVSENKQLAFPASIDSIPVSANQEDHYSMGTSAATKSRKIIVHLQHILAIELLCVVQAIDLAEISDEVSPKVLEIHKKIREVVPQLKEDREIAPDISRCVELIQKKKL